MSNKRIIIFDFDDTLINYKMKTPRQSYHMLNLFKKYGYIMAIITYNPSPYISMIHSGLHKFIDCIHYGDIDRDILFTRSLETIMKKHKITETELEEYKIYYLDDREDNIQKVKEKYPNIIDFHCYDINELHHFKKILRKK